MICSEDAVGSFADHRQAGFPMATVQSSVLVDFALIPHMARHRIDEFSCGQFRRRWDLASDGHAEFGKRTALLRQVVFVAAHEDGV
jgi:hypothetical protein